MTRSRAAAFAVFALLGLLGVAKFPGAGPYGLDASYYTQLAGHVARGDGYVTTVSLYNHGQILPARPSMLPLWPLVLGYCGRVLGVIVAANVLPKIFYLLDLVLLWILTRRLGERIGAPPYAALLVTLLLGLSATFYTATTHPYREGLAFALAFGALIAVDEFARRNSLALIAAAGVLTGLATLSRIQMAALAAGTLLALGYAWLRERRTIVALLVYGVCSAAVLVPWFLFSGSVFNLIRLRPDAPHVTLPAFYANDPPVTAASMLRALVVAFDVTSPYSFARVFSVAALIVPLALVIWMVRSRRERLPYDEARLAVTATTLTGVISVAMLVPYQGQFLPFYFGWRHGLVLIFLLAVAVPYVLARSGRALRIVTLAAVAISCAVCLAGTLQFIRTPALRYSEGEQQLFGWLARHPRPPMLLTTHAETLGMSTESRIHNTSCGAEAEVTRSYLRQLPIDYLVVYDGEQPCRFIDGIAGRELPLVAVFGTAPERVWLFGRSRASVLPSPPASR